MSKSSKTVTEILVQSLIVPIKSLFDAFIQTRQLLQCNWTVKVIYITAINIYSVKDLKGFYIWGMQ